MKTLKNKCSECEYQDTHSYVDPMCSVGNTYATCQGERQYGFILSRVFDKCGIKGRFYSPKDKQKNK